MKSIFRRTAVFALAAGWTVPGWAGTIQTRFVGVVVHDLPIGCSTRVVSSGGERYSVENTSDTPVNVAITAMKPGERDLKSGKYEPIPDIVWVDVSPTNLTIPAHGKAETDVTIRVPNDLAYANKKYQFLVQTVTTGGQMGVGLITRVRVHTVEKPPEMQPDKTNPKSAGASNSAAVAKGGATAKP